MTFKFSGDSALPGSALYVSLILSRLHVVADTAGCAGQLTALQSCST